MKEKLFELHQMIVDAHQKYKETLEDDESFWDAMDELYELIENLKED